MVQNENWYERQYIESRKVEDQALVGEDPLPRTNEPILNKGKNQSELKAVQTAARAQWNLAEWHFGRGEWDQAEKEYQRYIDEFPYVELDYGYRTDDARNRMREIAKIREAEDQKKNGPFR